MPIHVVAFDIDGTLYPNSAMYLRSMPFFIRHFRLVRAYSRIREHVRKIRPIEDLKGLERSLLAEDLGVSKEEAGGLIDQTIHQEWGRVFDHIDPYPNVREAIGRFKESGIRVAVSSDFPVEDKLRRLGLDDIFDCSLWSEDSGYLKPHPEPFRALAECVGVPEGEILFVGNSYRYDILGAHGAGFHTAHLRRRPVRNSVADLTFSNYLELADWVMAHNDGPNQN